jgi:hypothetical protein
MKRKAQSDKIRVSKRALIGRIDRKLKAQGKILLADRYGGVTGYAVVDVKRHTVVEAQVDLEMLARKLDVMKPWEQAA